MAEVEQNLDIDAVLKAISGCEPLDLGAKTMLLEGLPFAVKGGFEQRHALQKEFVDLAGSVLRESKQLAAEEAAAVSTTLETAGAELTRMKEAEAESAKAAEEAAAGLEAAESARKAAERAVEEAEAEHKKAESESEVYMTIWDEQRQEHARVASIVESFQMLAEGVWEEEEVKVAAMEVVQNLLIKMKADRAVVASAPHALSLKPDGRHAFDSIVFDALKKILPDYLAKLDAVLEEDAPKERHRRAEVAGLWAIADCGRDDMAMATAAVKGARQKQKFAGQGLEVERQQLERQGEVMAERTAKRARIEARTREVEESLAVVERLCRDNPEASSGSVSCTTGPAVATEAEGA